MVVYAYSDLTDSEGNFLLDTVSFSSATKIIMYYQKRQSVLDINSLSQGLCVKIGSSYYHFGSASKITGTNWGMGYIKSGSTQTNVGGPSAANTSSLTTWVWIKTIYDMTAGTVNQWRSGTISQSNNTLADAQNEAYVQLGAEQSGITYSGNLTELRYYFLHLANHDIGHAYFDIDADITSAGEAVIPEADRANITALSTISGGGKATIKIDKDPHDYTETDYTDNGRKSVTIYDSQGALRFKGEIGKVRVRYDTVIYEASQELGKLLRMTCGYNPVSYKSLFSKIVDNVVYDEFAGWGVDEFASKLLAFSDNNRYLLYAHPQSGSYNVANSGYDPNHEMNWFDADPSVKTGDPEFLYFNDQTKIDDRNSLGAYHERSILSDRSRIRYDATFQMYLKNAPAFDTVKIRIVWRNTTLANGEVDNDVTGDGRDHSYPRLRFYDYVLAAWANGDQFMEPYKDAPNTSNVDGSEDWQDSTLQGETDDSGISPIFDTTIDVLPLLDMTYATFKSKYMSEGALNNAGFTKFTMVLSAEGVAVDADALLYTNDPKFEIFFMELQFSQQLTKIEPQLPKFTSGLVASNTAKTITMDGSQGWELSTYPQGDGATKNDTFYITEQVDDVLDNIFAQNKFTQKDWEVSHNIDVDGMAETEDLTDIPVMQYVQKVKKLFNGVVYSSSTENKNILTVLETPLSSGVTITQDEMVFHKRQYETEYDYDSIKENVTVIGDLGIKNTQANSPANDNALGDEDIIYYDSELATELTVEAEAINKAARHLSPGVRLQFTLDLSKADYSALKEGLLFDVTITDSNSVLQLSETLLADNIVYTKEEGKEYLFVTGEKRF